MNTQTREALAQVLFAELQAKVTKEWSDPTSAWQKELTPEEREIYMNIAEVTVKEYWGLLAKEVKEGEQGT